MAQGWRVVSQKGTERLQPGARWEQVMEVTVVTDAGTSKTFDIPLGSYTADYVRATVDDWYAHEQAVNNL